MERKMRSGTRSTKRKTRRVGHNKVELRNSVFEGDF